MSTPELIFGTVRNRLVFALFLLFLSVGNAWAAPKYKTPIPQKVNGLISYWRFEGPVEQPGGQERLERPAPEVTLTPPIPGHWEWSGDRLLFFP